MSSKNKTGFSTLFYFILVTGIFLILAFGFTVGSGAINFLDGNNIAERNTLDISNE